MIQTLAGAADEVLAAIKDDDCMDAQRKRNVEEVLGDTTDTFFATLYGLVKQITDYGQEDVYYQNINSE